MFIRVAKALLIAVLALVLTVLLLGAIGAVGPIELTFSLLLAIGVFVLQVRYKPA